MAVNLFNKHFLSLWDFSFEEIQYLLKLSHKLKYESKHGIRRNSLKCKNIALLFAKPSTRTRCACEVVITEELGNFTYIDTSTSQLGYKESFADSARVLSSYYDAILFRCFSQNSINILAKYSKVPVYNGLSDEDHPTQVLADLMTIEEYFRHKSLSEIKIVFVGDTRNNMVNAWIYASAKLGLNFIAYGPEELHPNKALLDKIHEESKISGAKIEITSDPNCLIGADIIYTDVWVSMGEEDFVLERIKLLQNYKVTFEMLKSTQNPNVLFMHCLPSLHNFDTKFANKFYTELNIDLCEVTDEIFESRHSIVFNQVENRLHTIKAILIATLCKK